MKKSLLFSAVLAGLMLGSCSSSDDWRVVIPLLIRMVRAMWHLQLICLASLVVALVHPIVQMISLMMVWQQSML